MLEAVHAVHKENVVHTDLKPANFVLVKGRLKIIDFGIAKAVANDTVNIQRDQQIGTVNYMSPEAIQRMNNQAMLKVSGDLNALTSYHTRATCGRWGASCIR
jgi:serine/threonine-protein kinase TTK/MPS1